MQVDPNRQHELFQSSPLGRWHLAKGEPESAEVPDPEKTGGDNDCFDLGVVAKTHMTQLLSVRTL